MSFGSWDGFCLLGVGRGKFCEFCGFGEFWGLGCGLEVVVSFEFSMFSEFGVWSGFAS